MPVLPLFPRAIVAATRSNVAGFQLDASAPSPLWAIETIGIAAGS